MFSFSFGYDKNITIVIFLYNFKLCYLLTLLIKKNPIAKYGSTQVEPYFCLCYNRPYVKGAPWYSQGKHQHNFNKPERAYVHPSALIALGGPWAKDAAWIIPAVYDSETTYAVVKGNAVSFMYFLAQQKTAS